MGCGHSKINIYPRKSRSKNSSKKTVTPDKTESEEEDGVENELDRTETLDECDQKKTIKVKPFGGPLLAHTEISSSQQDFFRMLDEKIQNGPDYNAESEIERAVEAERLKALLKDWETASAGSRSLPTTPRRKPKTMNNEKTSKSAGTNRVPNYQIPQNVIHQSYGVAQQVNYHQVPNYVTQSPSHQLPAYPSALQYQAISPMYSSSPQPNYQRQYTPSYYNEQHSNSPVNTYNINNSPKHIPSSYEQSSSQYGSPSHMPPFGPVVHPNSRPPSAYSNGELQYYSTHHQIQYQQYKDAREQVLAQNQPPVVPPYRVQHQRNYQTSISIPVVVPNQQTDMHRKQYELT